MKLCLNIPVYQIIILWCIFWTIRFLQCPPAIPFWPTVPCVVLYDLVWSYMVFCSVWLYIAFSRGQFVSFIRNYVQIHCHTKTGSLAVFIRVEGKSLHSDRTNIVWPYHSIKMSFGLRDHTIIMHFLFRSTINAV